MSIKAASIRLLDETGKRLELVAAYGLSQGYLSKGPVELEKSLVDGEVIRKAEPISINVSKDSRRQYPEAKREGIDVDQSTIAGQQCGYGHIQCEALQACKDEMGEAESGSV